MKKKSIFIILTFVLCFSSQLTIYAKSKEVGKNGKSPLVVATSTKYPTKWTYVPTHNLRYNKKARKAGKSAFAATLTSFLKGKVTNPVTLAGVAASAYGTYYFVNSDEQNVYFSIKYYYRLIKKPKSDSNGIYNNYIEMKRITKISKYSNFKNGQSKTETRKTNQMWYF